MTTNTPHTPRRSTRSNSNENNPTRTTNMNQSPFAPVDEPNNNDHRDSQPASVSPSEVSIQDETNCCRPAFQAL